MSESKGDTFMSRTKELPTKLQIQERAYELYVERGCEFGRDIEDWLAAEQELMNLAAGKETWEVMELAAEQDLRPETQPQIAERRLPPKAKTATGGLSGGRSGE
jgi:hypothetical protein